MKKIGVIGGLGWPSTIDYYRLLCQKTNAYFADQGLPKPLPAPPIVLESLDMSVTRKLRGTAGDDASWQGFESVFRQCFQRLRDAGAEFGLIASNTPHARLKGIVRGLDLPVLSILDATAQAVCRLGARRVLVLGTTVTMHSTMYPEVLAAQGVETVPKLPDAEIAALGRIIDEDLYQGAVGDADQFILTLCARYAGADDVVCLGCTELSLAFPEHQDDESFVCEGISFLNTTVAHVEAALVKSGIPVRR